MHRGLWTHSANGEPVRAHNVSVNHSADARGELSMAHDVSCEDMAMHGELLVAHDSGGESHSELYMARDARDITQCEPIGSAEHCRPERDDSHFIWERSHMNSSQVKNCGVSTNPSRCGEQLPYVSEDLKLRGEPPPREANDLPVTAEADDGPCEVLPPHGSTGQSSKCVEALAPWLRRQVDDVDPQECRESTAHNACDAPGACGELRTHTPSDAMQRTPLVFTETHHPARDDRNAADRLPGSGGKKQAREQSHTTPSRTNVPMAGPST